MTLEQGKLKVVDSNSRLLHYGTRFLVVLIALGAGVLSFDGLAQLSVAAGVREELSYVWALVIDGFILVATFATFALKDRTDGDKVKKYYAWVVLAIFVIISILGNAMHALPQEESYILPLWVKVSVNAVPPIALFLAIHLIIIMVSPTSDEKKIKDADRKRIEREERMKERKLLAAERLNEKEAQAIEKGTPITPSAPVTQVREEKPTPPYIPNPQPVPKTSNTEPVETTAEMTKEEALEKLENIIQSGGKLPSGREVGEWVGLKERAGQNLLKKAKEQQGIAVS